jgi:N12 class adenine-specific DNA methylase
LNGVLYAIENHKDSGIDFGQMNVDHLFVDESHKFKNLTFTTRHSRVAGLGNQEGSQKALNMLFAVRTLQQKFDSDLCVTFLSGTPISNSLTEMYLIFKYLRPKEMARQQIDNFDGWAAVFARKTIDFEFSVTNEIIAKERFRHFIKVPELALFYNEITDFKTAKHINLDKPDLDESLVNIKPTPDQEDFIRKLMAFANTGDATLIGRKADQRGRQSAHAHRHQLRQERCQLICDSSTKIMRTIRKTKLMSAPGKPQNCILKAMCTAAPRSFSAISARPNPTILISMTR